MSTLRALASLALLVVGPSIARAQEPPRSDQEVLADRVVDHGWGFQLLRPDGETWRVMGEAAVRRVQPQAIAGFFDTARGVPLVLIVSPGEGTALDAARRRISGALPGATEVVRLEAAQVCGRPGAAFEIRSTQDGNEVRFGGEVVIEGGRIYELISFGTPHQTSLGSCYGRWDVLSLLPGPAPGREPATLAPPDAHGVGWRVRHQVLESVALGARIDPAHTGLRLAVGASARQVSPDAEAALVDDAAQGFVALLAPRPVAGASVADVEALLRASLLPGDAAQVGTLSLALGDGEALVLRRYAVGPADVLLGVAEREGAPRLSVVGAWATAKREALEAELARGLAGVTPLDGAARTRLAHELEALPEGDGFVGETIAYRGGIVRSYAHDLTWTRPRGGAWTVLIDDAARAPYGEGTLLVARAPSLGLTAWLKVHRVPGYDGPRFHAWARGSYEVEGPPARELAAGATTWLVSEHDDAAGPARTRRVVATTTEGDRCIVLGVSGAPADLAANPDVPRTLALGLDLLDHDIVDLVQTEDAWRHERLGFLLRRPAPGWTFAPGDQAGPAAVGSVRLDDGKGHRLEVLAVAAGGEDVTDPAFYADYLQETVLATVREHLEVTPSPSTSKETFAGVPCRRVVAKGASGVVTLFLFYRAGVHYVFAMFDPDGHGPSVPNARRCFELLD